MLDVGGEYSDTLLASRAREMLPRARAAVAAALKAGVKLTAGSDMRYEEDAHRRIADEMEALAKHENHVVCRVRRNGRGVPKERNPC